MSKANEEMSQVERLVMWLKEQGKIQILTMIGFLPLVVFLDLGLDIMIIRDWGWIRGIGFIASVIFYAEFCKKYRDT